MQATKKKQQRGGEGIAGPLPLLMLEEETARLVRVTSRTIRNLVKRDLFPKPIRVGPAGTACVVPSQA